MDFQSEVKTFHNKVTWNICWLNIYKTESSRNLKKYYDFIFNTINLPSFVGGIVVRPNMGLVHKSILIPLAPTIFLRVDKHGNAVDIDKKTYNIHFKQANWSEGIWECQWSPEKDSWEAVSIADNNLPYDSKTIKLMKDQSRYPQIFEEYC